MTSIAAFLAYGYTSDDPEWASAFERSSWLTNQAEATLIAETGCVRGRMSRGSLRTYIHVQRSEIPVWDSEVRKVSSDSLTVDPQWETQLARYLRALDIMTKDRPQWHLFMVVGDQG